MFIDTIRADWVLDSRGFPTVRAKVRLDSGATGACSVPSGASTGGYEALELRDKGDAFHGKGVERAVDSVNGEISAFLAGASADRQLFIDSRMRELDGSLKLSIVG